MTDLEVQRLTAWPPDGPIDEIVDVYRAAFTAPGYDETPDDVERFRESLPQHADREGFRLELARRAGRLVGFAYGYTGRRGQWWSDRVLARVPATITDLWVDGHFECSGWQELARIDEDSALLGLDLSGRSAD